MIAILVVLAVIIIPVIANFYLSAWAMKLNGDEDITVGDVADDMDELICFAIIPIFSSFFLFVLLINIICKFLKDVKLL